MLGKAILVLRLKQKKETFSCPLMSNDEKLLEVWKLVGGRGKRNLKLSYNYSNSFFKVFSIFFRFF